MGITDTRASAEQAAEFILKYATYKDKEKLKNRIQGHLDFKTCRVVLDPLGNVCAVCLWNISPDGTIADIIDLVIREDYRKRDMMRWILRDGMRVWPVKFLRYSRDYTEDGHDRGPKQLWSVERFLRRKG